MKTYNGIILQYRNAKRDKYMSLSDLVQDLTTETLIKILSTLEQFKKQMVIMYELEERNELNDDYYFELLESCDGI